MGGGGKVESTVVEVASEGALNPAEESVVVAIDVVLVAVMPRVDVEVIGVVVAAVEVETTGWTIGIEVVEVAVVEVEVTSVLVPV